MRIDPDFERSTVQRLHHLLTHGSGDLPQSVEKLIDDSESLIISLLQQREIMRHALSQIMNHDVPAGGIAYRRAHQILLDVPANSPGTEEFAGASRTITKGDCHGLR